MQSELMVSDVLARLDDIRGRTSEINEEKLETLLYYIEEGGVIPIVGQELYTFTGDSSAHTFDQLLARSLAAALRLAPSRLGENFTLSDVIAAHRPFATDRRLIYEKLYELLSAEPLRSSNIPTPILQLASIRDFHLFVSTTFDSFLERALDLIRYGGEPATRARAFSPYTPTDLQDGDCDKQGSPVVFKLFGEASPNPYFAATDGDVVEFLHRLQFDKRPVRLFAELKKSHLLILGTNYPNWLARFFLRITKDETLWVNREKLEYFADRQLENDPSLISFIRYFSKSTECFAGVPPEAFVERLFAEWLARNPDRALAGPLAAPLARAPRAEECVFVSYASEDLDAATRIKLALESIGWPVWFDKTELRSGTEYERMIERTIKAAEVCVVVLSPATASSEPRFFRQEWKWALERQRFFTGLDRTFVHPVRLTPDTPIPADLTSYNALNAFDGNPVQEFVEDMTRILRQMRKERR